MTIGKLAVGIQVIACDAVIDDSIEQNNRIQVFPGGGLNWQRLEILHSGIVNVDLSS